MPEIAPILLSDIHAKTTSILYQRRAEIRSDLADASHLSTAETVKAREELDAIEAELLNYRPLPGYFEKPGKRDLEYMLLTGETVISMIQHADRSAAGPMPKARQYIKDAFDHWHDPEKCKHFMKLADFSLAIYKARE